MPDEYQQFGEWQVSREGYVTLPARKICIPPDRLAEPGWYDVVYDRLSEEAVLVRDFIPALREARKLAGSQGED